jgi:signal transduction histidine kinase
MIGVGAVQVVAAALATVLVAHYEARRSYAMLDASLVEHAAMVTSVIEAPERPTAKAILHRELLTLPARDVYVLSDPTGKVIAASGDWRPREPLPDQPRSFMTAAVGDRKYRALVERDITMFDEDPREMAKLPKLTLGYGSSVSELEEHVRDVTWTAAWIGLAILLASLAATGWAVRKGLEPLMQLAGRAARIDAFNWQLDQTHSDVGPQELVPVSTAFTKLVERLRAAFLRERQFSADAAHEMKTAIAIVKSTLQLTLEREGAVGGYRSGICRALEDTDRMQELAIGMLQLAKIEGLAPAGIQGQSVIDIKVAVNEVERQLKPLLAARAIQLTVKVPEEPVFVRLLKDDMQMILKNLLENAIHYSDDGTTVSATVEVQDGNCILMIADNGCGIHPDALPHIFERFYRGDESRSRGSGGAGLGLAIVHAIVKRAGGTVTTESSIGNGSTFTVRLASTLGLVSNCKDSSNTSKIKQES